jgi:hypothetical protein
LEAQSDLTGSDYSSVSGKLWPLTILVQGDYIDDRNTVKLRE